MARPTKLNDPMPGGTEGETRADRILMLLRQGAYLETAATSAGIHPATLHEWLARGRGETVRGLKPTRAFAEFAEAVSRARADGEINLLMRVRAASTAHRRKREHAIVVDGKREVVELAEDVDGDWRAAAWVLERTHPTKYGRRQAIEVSGPDGGAIEVRDAEASRLAAAWDRFAEENDLPRALEAPPAVELGADGLPIEDAVVVNDDEEGDGGSGRGD